MSENAKKVWRIAERYEMQTVVETYIDDLEAFAKGIDCDSEQEVIHAIYDLFACAGRD